MSVSLYRSSAPVFIKMLTAMGVWLNKAEAHAAEKKFKTSVLCVSRLSPDMLSLTGQVHLATAFAKNGLHRLAGRTPPDFTDLEDDFAAYRTRIDETLALLNAFKTEDFAGAGAREVTVRVSAEKELTMTGADYFLNFALPNFYFHCTTAYAILRHNGVSLGKADFMGADT